MPFYTISRYFKITGLLLLISILCACEDVIHVDLDTGEPRLVVDAEILWRNETTGSNQEIYLSRLTEYYNEETTKVSDANVIIKNEAGDEFIFSETETPGTYACTNFIPAIGAQYQLEITVDGEVYTATETMIGSPEIKRIEQKSDGGFLGKDNQISIFYDDPANEDNYYLTRYDTNFLQYPYYSLTDGDFYDGNEIEDSFSDEDLEVGERIDITFRCISEQFYNYITLINESSSDNPFGTPPANIRGNIINQTNANHFAFGYFRLSEAKVTEYTFQ
ncbi:DUF4249 domain-containing protein [Zunongwangia sp.]|uniref:DUF4249 domain-containing protein n=1 Tax=Zunongwangia sp. TaxID=1965325 RepID=UPI003AA9B363